MGTKKANKESSNPQEAVVRKERLEQPATYKVEFYDEKRKKWTHIWPREINAYGSDAAWFLTLKEAVAFSDHAKLLYSNKEIAIVKVHKVVETVETLYRQVN